MYQREDIYTYMHACTKVSDVGSNKEAIIAQLKIITFKRNINYHTCTTLRGIEKTAMD
jgi:hypothetical protein